MQLWTPEFFKSSASFKYRAVQEIFLRSVYIYVESITTDWNDFNDYPELELVEGCNTWSCGLQTTDRHT